MSFYSRQSRPTTLTGDEEMPMLTERAFDFNSVFSYTAKQDSEPAQQNTQDPFAKFVETVVLVLSHVIVFFTLPITVWVCFRNVPQWERLVVYRMGKLSGVKGPGIVFIIPWIDNHHTLDLRTKLIQSPLQQFLTQDQAIFEAGCNFHYRISDPLVFVNSYQDPKFHGLQKLAQAVAYKRLTSKEERDLQKYKRTVEDEVLRELNGVISAWGIEMNAVEFTDMRQITPAQPVNPLGKLFKHVGSSLFPGQSSQYHSEDLIAAGNGCAVEIVQSQDALLNLLRNRLSTVTADESLNSVIHVDVQCEAGVSRFVIQFLRGHGSVVEGADENSTADAVVKVNDSTLLSLLNGGTKSQFLQAYLCGDIIVEGNSQVLAAFQQCLG